MKYTNTVIKIVKQSRETQREQKINYFCANYINHCLLILGMGGLSLSNVSEEGIAQWLERGTRDEMVLGAAGTFSFPGSTFCADFYFGIRSTPVLAQ